MLTHPEFGIFYFLKGNNIMSDYYITETYDYTPDETQYGEDLEAEQELDFS